MGSRLAILPILFAVFLLTCCVEHPTVSSVRPSGVLPVFRIDTRKSMSVESKDRWISGKLTIDSTDLVQKLYIKGRGNTTWRRSEKRPYRIKLDEATSLFEAKQSKHYVLLSEATSPYVMIATVMGFELSRRLGMDYTPQVSPIELVLNGDYRGVYLLTEQLRVEPGRVEVKPWPKRDSWTDRGGWLLEIDGWPTFQRLTINSRMGVNITLEYHYPSDLSLWQRKYINQLLDRVDSAICVADKSSTEWEQLVDIDALARFYIVNELMDNCEAFSGSCWLSRDAGDAAKFKFGPVWDFGSAFSHRYIDKPECFVYEEMPSYCSPLWLKELIRFPRFQQKVREHYRRLKAKDGDNLDGFIDEFVQRVAPACSCEASRWPQSPVANLKEQAEWAKQYYKRKIAFLDSKWL